MDELVIDDRQLHDTAGDLRRDGDDVGAHRPVARPGRGHVGLPRGPDGDAGQRQPDQRHQHRHGVQPARRRQVGGGRRRPRGLARLRPYLNFGVRHQPPHPAGQKHYCRQQDHVNGEHEQRRVPDMAQQPEMAGEPADRDQQYPGGEHHRRDRGDVNAE